MRPASWHRSYIEKTFALLALLPALALANTAANAATTIPISTGTAANPFFGATSESPDESTVTAIFGHTVAGASKTFDDVYTFTLLVDGIGSGSVSTSTSGGKSKLTITEVIINGVTFTAAEAAAGIDDVVITADVLNTIEIIGTTGGKTIAGTYSGTATFEANSVPEPMTWTTFLLGFGFMGLALRRKFGALVKAA